MDEKLMKCLHCNRKALGYIKGEDDIDPKLCSKCNIKLMCDDSSDDEECNEEECDEESCNQESFRGQPSSGESCDEESDDDASSSNSDSDNASKSLDITANATCNKTDTENVQPNIDQQDQSIENRMDLDQPGQDELFVEEPKHSKESFKKIADVCNAIHQVIKKDLGGLGHSGDGRGSIDGEITQSTCKSIVKLANITDQDVIFDAGCSGGRALMIMVALSNAKAGIGMEIDDNRYALANLHNHSLMKNHKDISLPVHFLHQDVTTLTTFEGVTVLYMWDRAFVPSFYDNVAEAIRKSYSLRCLISEKKRDFWEKLLIPLKETSEVKTINLAAIGGNCTDTLYVYELEPFCDPDLIEKDESYWNLNDSIDTATNFDKRQQTASSNHCAWLNTKERRPKLNLYTILDQEENIHDLELMKTYYPNGRLKKYVPNPTDVITRVYTIYRCESESSLYYRRDLHMVSIFEINAMKYSRGSETDALIVPSYDVETNTILIGMQYRYAPSNNRVTCSIYNINSKTYTFKLTYQEVKKARFNFDHTVKLPVDLNTYEQILEGYRDGFSRFAKEDNPTSAITARSSEDTELGATTSDDGESQTKRPRISKPPERWICEKELTVVKSKGRKPTQTPKKPPARNSRTKPATNQINSHAEVFSGDIGEVSSYSSTLEISSAKNPRAKSSRGRTIYQTVSDPTEFNDDYSSYPSTLGISSISSLPNNQQHSNSIDIGAVIKAKDLTTNTLIENLSSNNTTIVNSFLERDRERDRDRDQREKEREQRDRERERDRDQREREREQINKSYFADLSTTLISLVDKLSKDNTLNLDNMGNKFVGLSKDKDEVNRSTVGSLMELSKDKDKKFSETQLVNSMLTLNAIKRDTAGAYAISGPDTVISLSKQ